MTHPTSRQNNLACTPVTGSVDLVGSSLDKAGGRVEHRPVQEGGKPGLFERLVGVVRLVVDLVLRAVHWIVSIVIRPPGPPGNCAGIPGIAEGYHPNPVQCNDVYVTAFDSGLGLKVYPGRSQPETFVTTRNGIKGFDAAFQLEKRFPPSSPVVVTAVHFGQPARIEAFSGGSMTGKQMMAPTTGVVQGITFTGGFIDRVLVIPSGASDDTLVIEFCH
jgi:hypothetical protein